MNTVCRVLGVARYVHELRGRDDDWVDGRHARVQDLISDGLLVEAVRVEIRNCRRMVIAALVNWSIEPDV